MSQQPHAPFAIICALEEELCHLRALLPTGHEVWRAGRRYEVTTLAARPVLLTCCGIGMLSAAAVTEALIGQWQPAAILNYGCTGAHRTELLPGDMIIGGRVVAYEHARFGAEERLMRYLQGATMERIDYCQPAEMLLTAAQQAATLLDGQHEPWPQNATWPTQVPHRAPQVIVGTVASADRWNRTGDAIGALVERYDSHCEDMEAGAIALTCLGHQVPFLTIKDISNNELLRTTADGRFLEENTGQLGRRAARLLHLTLQLLVNAS